MEGGVELSALIAGLRRELTVAMSEGHEGLVRFAPGAVELELTVVVERETDPHAAVRFWVVEAGAGLTRSDSVTQRITMQLHPQPAVSAGPEAWIKGKPLPDEQ